MVWNSWAKTVSEGTNASAMSILSSEMEKMQMKEMHSWVLLQVVGGELEVLKI